MPKKPKWKEKPKAEKKAPLPQEPKREDGQLIFSFLRFDSVSKWKKEDYDSVHDIWEILEKLKSFEQRRWSEIAANQDRDHQIPFSDIEKFAQEQAITKGLDEYDGIWSFHLTGTQRIWGVRAGVYFMVIWWDPNHLICPSLKRRT